LERPSVAITSACAHFTFRPWTRETGVGGGVGGFLSGGRLFEKAGVHVSSAKARLSPDIAKLYPGGRTHPDYVSASISVIVHPRSPRVPTVHMNTRFLATSEYWFGGGSDLTPLLADQRRPGALDADQFHTALKRACDAYNPDWHARFKAACDEYFFLPHRNEPRGIGGIFFDHHNTGDFSRDLAFSREVGEAFLTAYTEIVRRRMTEQWSVEEREEQTMRRGRYVEFNLLYDKGTMFGLKQGANIETLLSSMPPLVTWT
jgi:coproporphyrinogen III oxidase